MRSGRELPDDLVPHPRFGKAYSPDDLIPADPAKQNYSTLPLAFYRDRLLVCHDCDRPFVFSASEQRYWYEDLGIYVQAQCLHCTECRRARHDLRRRHGRYSRLIRKADLSDGELATLLGDATCLYLAGVIRREQGLRRLKNLALARIPGDQATEAALRVLSEVPEIGGRRLGRAEALLIGSIIRLLDEGADQVAVDQAKGAMVVPRGSSLGSQTSFTKAFESLRDHGVLSWHQDRRGAWGIRPTPEAIAEFRGGTRNG
jgi:hypothetical protein